MYNGRLMRRLLESEGTRGRTPKMKPPMEAIRARVMAMYPMGTPWRCMRMAMVAKGRDEETREAERRARARRSLHFIVRDCVTSGTTRRRRIIFFTQSWSERGTGARRQETARDGGVGRRGGRDFRRSDALCDVRKRACHVCAMDARRAARSHE
jgi:hypothetical protein